MAKARVTTRRFVSISRLELFTAVLAVKISALIKKELEMKELTKYICTDIKIALGYIAKNKKVTIYFANENLHILDISQILQVERSIIKLIQSKYFSEEMKKTAYKYQIEAKIKRSSQIYNLDAYIVENGIIRVGGRLDKSNLNNECKHPVVFPKGSPISKLIIAWCYKKTSHAGRGATLNEIRTSGFWIAFANSTTRKFILYCVVCRSLRGKLEEQKMSELAFDRLQEEPPFYYCGVVFFGPFVICSKPKELKRYGVMFTCLCSRAIHIEVAHSLDTDSFLLTL